MARVERGNVVLNVEDNEVDYYLRCGYSLTNELGMIIERATPNDYVSLQQAYVDAKSEIEKLKAENEALKEEISAYKMRRAKR